MAQIRDLTGRQKTAVLLISLGSEVSAEVLKHLDEDDIEDVTLEIANMRRVDPEVKETVLQEFYELCLAQNYLAIGGIDYAKEMLEKALGPVKAGGIIQKLVSSLQIRPFDFARKTEPSQLFNFIQNEHPQTIALIMSYLHPEQAGAILSALPAAQQVEVAKRIATMDRTSPEVLKEIETVLEKRLSSFVLQDYNAGGVETAVAILNRVDRGTEKTIIESLEEEDPELAEEIKKRMFVFENIVTMDDRSIQRVLREVDLKDLALALKTASEDVTNRIFKNISKRAVEMLKEDMSLMGPVRLRDVEEAQQKIVNIIRQLDESGEIIIARGGEDEIVV
ncbi:MAG TPA: flagellar motor switch protein FliG [Firmicutes bacterium]|jgi:flagellar motor switch protein FliG|nr:flagellar motor switch protein FliG [Bacillota bacterium]